MQGASPLASPGLNPRGTGSPCRCGKLNGGGLPRRCRRGGRQRYPAGACLLCRLPALPLRCPRGACPLCRLLTLPLTCFLAPIPQPPSRREGGDQGYFMQGAEPLASPGLNPRGTGSPCRCGKLNGGACPGVAGAAGVSGTRRRACLLCRLPTLPLWCPRGGAPALSPVNPALTCFPAPIPPAPFPAGRG